MRLEPTIRVRLGEEEMKLSDAMARATATEGVTHMSIDRAAYVSMPQRGALLDADGFRQLTEKKSSIFDMTVVIDVKTGEQTPLYDLTHPQFRAQIG
jgi:hypothetical protein